MGWRFGGIGCVEEGGVAVVDLDKVGVDADVVQEVSEAALESCEGVN